METIVRAVVIPAESEMFTTLIFQETIHETLRDMVGGVVEHIGVRIKDQKLEGFINDAGKMYHLPPNVMATILYRMPGDVVAGPMVLTGPVDDEGGVTSVPIDTIEYLGIAR